MTRSILPDYSVTASFATEIAEDSSDDDLDSLPDAFPSAPHVALAAGESPGAAAPDGAPDAAPLRAILPESVAGERLDKALAQCFPEYSRSRLQAWVEDGRVTLDGETAKVRQKVAGGEAVCITPAALPEQLAFAPEPVPLDAVYEDATLAVFNKPPGLVVHPAAGNWSGTLLNGLLHRYGQAAADLPRAGIVHRLDKETSGLMVVARTLVAQTDLVRQLQARTVKRHYAALVWGARRNAPSWTRPSGATLASAPAWLSCTGRAANRRAPASSPSPVRNGTAPRCRSCSVRWTRDERTRYACISRTSGIRCWATRYTSLATSDRPCRVALHGRHCTPGGLD